MARARLRGSNRATDSDGGGAEIFHSTNNLHLRIGSMTTLDCPTHTVDDVFEELRKRLAPTTLLRRDEPLAKRTTLRVGGPAEIYVEPASEEELCAIVEFCSAHEVPRMLLGRGSNLLIRDGGIRGVVICLSHPQFSCIEWVDGKLRFGAGARLKNVAIEARRNEITGMEFLE